MTIKGDIRKQYNFNYNCVYHMGNIPNNAQYEYDLSQIISKPEDGDELYNIKLFGIFTVLNENKYTKYIFKMLREKMAEEFSNENDNLHNIILFHKILSYDFLYLYHPCICDIYHDNEIKTENLHRLLEKLDTYTL
jgi:hypothetical protein